jgi:hypothetical protein
VRATRTNGLEEDTAVCAKHIFQKGEFSEKPILFKLQQKT